MQCGVIVTASPTVSGSINSWRMTRLTLARCSSSGWWDRFAAQVCQRSAPDARSWPNTHFVLDSFATLRGDDAFAAGLEIIEDAIAREASDASPDIPQARSSSTRPRRLSTNR